MKDKKNARKSIAVILFAAILMATIMMMMAIAVAVMADGVPCNDTYWNSQLSIHSTVVELNVTGDSPAMSEGDVWVRFDNAHCNNFYPFSTNAGQLGKTYYANFTATDDLYTEVYGYECCLPGWCREHFGRPDLVRMGPWVVERKSISDSRYVLLIRGASQADCACGGNGYVSGEVQVLPESGWKITEVNKCEVNPDSRGRAIYCEVNKDTGKIRFAGGSTCEGCCCCIDSGQINITVTVEKVPALKYAPNFWFDSEEQLYPCSPFFDDEDLSGEDNKNDYYNLNFSQKMDNFTIYYHTVDTGEEVVYEYWLYYAYNNWRNEHYHDWETVYVFVDKSTEEVTRVVASAHTDAVPNNDLFNPQFAAGEHAGILVEEGSHASCTDRNNNGLFERAIDITNGYTYEPGYLYPFAWGIMDRTIGWLVTYDSYTPKEITSDFISKFGGLERFDDDTLGMLPVEVPILGGICLIPIGGEPPTHPWHQTRYDDNPYEIIPVLDRFITGIVSGSDTTGAIVVILSEEQEPYYTFADENGNFLLNNIPYGVYDIVVNLEGYTPYKQRFMHEGNTSLGVNGTLYIIPESEAFRIEGIATGVEGNIVLNATINVYDENNTKMFTTLTDENGTYLVTASVEHVYTVEAIFGNKTGTFYNVSGEQGEVVKVNLIVALPGIWANSTMHSEAIKWSGSKTVVNGKVHSNDGIKISGSDNTINGTTSYVSTFEDSGSKNIYVYPPIQVSAKPMPVQSDIANYKPGGSEATSAQAEGKYHFIDGKFHVSDSDIVLNGLYYATDEVKLSGSNISGVFTIVAEGKIDISGSELKCSAYSGDLLFMSNNTKLKIAGSKSFFSGIIYIPKGEIDISGSTNTINGSLFGNTVKLSGSEMRINAR
jgi:hypothetical protein